MFYDLQTVRVNIFTERRMRHLLKFFIYLLSKPSIIYSPNNTLAQTRTQNGSFTRNGNS